MGWKDFRALMMSMSLKRDARLVLASLVRIEGSPGQGLHLLELQCSVV